MRTNYSKTCVRGLRPFVLGTSLRMKFVASVMPKMQMPFPRGRATPAFCQDLAGRFKPDGVSRGVSGPLEENVHLVDYRDGMFTEG